MVQVAPRNLIGIREYELGACAPYSFELTARKPRYGYLFSPSESYQDGVAWSGMRLDSGKIVGIRAESLGSIWQPRIVLRLFADEVLTDEEIDTAQRIVENVLGVRENIEEFYNLAESHPVLREAKADLFGMRDSPFPDLFSGVILTLLLHRAPWKRSLKMLDLLYSHYGTEVSFDSHRIWVVPSLEKIASVPEDELRTRCHLGYRGRVLKLAVGHLLRNTFRFVGLERLSPKEAMTRLMEIPGVGEYSAEILSPHPTFPVDSWSVKVFDQFFGLKLSGRFEDMARTVKNYASETFGRWQSYAYAYILHDLEKLAHKFRVAY